ncbi:MAG: ribosome-associated translation inhibitor RaiA [Ktedonobacteraceae bacterium]
MQLIIKGRQMEVTSQLRQRIERKVQRLARFVHEATRVEVTVIEEQTRSNRDRFCVQLALSGGTQPIHSEVSALNATTALDLVLDKVVAQLGRKKDRQVATRRHADAVKVLTLSRSGTLLTTEDNTEQEEDYTSTTMLEEEQNEEIWSQVKEIRRLPTKPMNDQEVIARMEQEGVSFLPFFNQETGTVNVMYKLDDGGYGLLVPAVE